jgi:hypothetical protein
MDVRMDANLCKLSINSLQPRDQQVGSGPFKKRSLTAFEMTGLVFDVIPSANAKNLSPGYDWEKPRTEPLPTSLLP